MRKTFEVITDHFQFYIGDSKLWNQVDVASLWKDQDGRVVSGGGIVGVGTIRFGGRTRISVIVDENVDIQGWEKIGEFQAILTSGKVLFWGPEKTSSEEIIAMDILAGEYLGAVFLKGSETVKDEMSEEGQDEYMIILRKTP